jgi:hypothetical protein
MKKLFLILVMLSLTAPAYCSFYIVNADNKIIARADYIPNKADLESRGEIAVFTKEDIPLNKAEYRDGKIILHKETSSEKSIRESEQAKVIEEKKIDMKVRKMACEKLVEEGEKFTKVNCNEIE